MHIRNFRYARYATEGAELSVGPVKGQQCCPGMIARTASLPTRSPACKGLARRDDAARSNFRWTAANRIRSCEADRSSARKAAVTYRKAAAAIVPCLA